MKYSEKKAFNEGQRAAYLKLAKGATIVLGGTIGILGEYAAIATSNPIIASTSTTLLYITAEAANEALGSERMLCQKAYNKFKQSIKKLHR
jgi:acyl CoA:acetate/3-ketoacid CoA transferase alpha subunit